MPTNRCEFLGVAFDRLSQEQALAHLARVTHKTQYNYVVTPNVDHIVRLHDDHETGFQMKAIYEGADLCLCDSKILQLLGGVRGVRLPVIPGSELTQLMFEQVILPGDRIAVVGGDEDLLSTLKLTFPQVDFVQHCPPMGLRQNAPARKAAAAFIAQSGARFSFIAVGSPQQELIAAAVKAFPEATGRALCIGAALEFVTGRQRRAPVMAQRLGLEWAHRLLSNPRRMWRRYLLEGPRIFVLAYRWGGATKNNAASE